MWKVISEVGQNSELERINSMNYKLECEYRTLREAESGDKPRERLERLGIEALTDKELVMLVIGSGTVRRPVDEISEDLLELLDRTPEAKTEDIMLISGLGRAKASAIEAATSANE